MTQPVSTPDEHKATAPTSIGCFVVSSEGASAAPSETSPSSMAPAKPALEPREIDV